MYEYIPFHADFKEILNDLDANPISYIYQVDNILVN
jgi:hypothetical protein